MDRKKRTTKVLVTFTDKQIENIDSLLKDVANTRAEIVRRIVAENIKNYKD